MRILQIWIVEDSAPDTYLIQLALSKTGVPMEIQSFADGDRAMEAIETCAAGSAVAPDIVLLDLHLPKLDGIDVLRAIRAAPKLSRVRVAVFGQPHPNAWTPKADCYMRKSGDLDKFVAEIGNALRQLQPDESLEE